MKPVRGELQNLLKLESKITRENNKNSLDRHHAYMLIEDLGILPLSCPIDGCQIKAIQRIKRHISEKYWTVKINNQQ